MFGSSSAVAGLSLPLLCCLLLAPIGFIPEAAAQFSPLQGSEQGVLDAADAIASVVSISDSAGLYAALQTTEDIVLLLPSELRHTTINKLI